MGQHRVIGAVLAAMVAAVIVVGFGSPARAGCNEGTPLTSAELRQAESRFVSLINGERAAAGLGSLAGQSRIVEVGRGHAGRMAADGRIYHNDAYFSMHDELNASMLGENVGVGCDAEQVHRAFMNSAPHRANILKGEFSHVGLGAATDGIGRLYVVEGFATIKASAPAPAPQAVAPPPPPASVAPAAAEAPAQRPATPKAEPKGIAPQAQRAADAPASTSAPVEPRTVGAGASEFSPVSPPAATPRDIFDPVVRTDGAQVAAVAALLVAAGLLVVAGRGRGAAHLRPATLEARIVQMGPSVAGLGPSSQTPADARIVQKRPEPAVKVTPAARR